MFCTPQTDDCDVFVWCYLVLEKWRSPEFYEQEVHRIQLPFSAKLAGAAVVGAEERQERRANQLRRLQEINARRREEKNQQDQERLDNLLAVQVMQADIYINMHAHFNTHACTFQYHALHNRSYTQFLYMHMWPIPSRLSA